MKKTILATFLLFITACFSFAQTSAPPGVGTPPGAGDSNLQDNDIKLRSVELERIKREAEKTASVRREDGVELDFSVIKSDFEGIQLEQAKIIGGYQASEKVDYDKINQASGKMTEMAIRLKSNLFLTEAEKESSKGTGDETKSAQTKNKSVRDLIIELDNAIGDFVTNKMFANLKTVDPELSKKAQADLGQIIKLSGDLWLESKKKKTS